MANTNYFKVKTGMNLQPLATSVAAQGDVAYNSGTNLVEVFTTGTESVATNSNTLTLTNKTLSGNTAVNLISGSGTLTLNTTGTITVPNATDTLVAKTTTDTLTNKTLTTPTINGAALSGTLSGGHTLSGAVTFSSAGTAYTVTNNARVSGELGVGGAPGGQQFNATVLFARNGNDNSTNASPALETFLTPSNTTSALSAQVPCCYFQFGRTTTANVTDTTAIIGAQVQLSVTPSAATTYTNSSSINAGYYVAALNNNGSGTLAMTSFSQYYSEADSTVGLTNKYGLQIGNITGATNNFAIKTGTGIVQFGGATAQTSYDTSTATSGTITAGTGKPGLIINSAGGTTLTIKLPASPMDGQIYWVGSVGAFTTVTWQDSGGTAGNVIGGQVALGGVNRGQTFLYDNGLTKWLAIS